MSTTARTFARKILPALAMSALVAVASSAGAEDAASQAGRRWTLTFSHGPLKIVTVADANGRDTSYHYMTMKVENKTAFPRSWNPHIVGTTDTPHAPYMAGGWTLAVDKVRQKEGDPTLVCVEESQYGPDKKAKKIAVGEVLNVVAIFGPLDPLYDKFTISVQGLVNPLTIVKVLKYGDGQQIVLESAYAARNAKVKEALKKAAAASGSAIPAPTEEYQEVTERRAFVMEYERLGDEFHANDNPIDFVREQWEILGEPKLERVIGGK